MVDDRLKIILLLVAKSHPISLGVTTAREVKAAEVDAVRKKLRCVLETLSFVAGISMHVDYTGHLFSRSVGVICGLNKACTKLLALCIVDFEAIDLKVLASIVCGLPILVGVIVFITWRSDNHLHEH